MIELASNRYGKAAIRIVRVGRDTTPHRLRDVTVAVALEGDFAAAHTDGDNSLVVATDTMKNTAYAFAADHLAGSIPMSMGAWCGFCCRLPSSGTGGSSSPRSSRSRTSPSASAPPGT